VYLLLEWPYKYRRRCQLQPGSGIASVPWDGCIIVKMLKVWAVSSSALLSLFVVRPWITSHTLTHVSLIWFLVSALRSHDELLRVTAARSNTLWKRNIRVTPKLAIMRTSFKKVKSQRSRSPGRLMLRPGVRYIFRTERPTNFKLQTKTVSPWWTITSNVKGQGRDVRCWPISRERKVPETPGK